MKYIIYKTTNVVNGKIYIGKHQTNDLNDDYLGSGTYFRRALAKYGKENFKREILYEFQSEEDMIDKEIEIVNKEFVARKDTYNLTLGGYGSWYAVNSTGRNIYEGHANQCRKQIIEARKQLRYLLENDSDYYKRFCEKVSKSVKERWKIKGHPWTGRNHSNKTREQMKRTFQEIGHQKGEKNSQFGTRWIYNLDLEENKKILKTDPIPDGWQLGRIIDFEKHEKKRKENLKRIKQTKILKQKEIQKRAKKAEKERQELKLFWDRYQNGESIRQLAKELPYSYVTLSNKFKKYFK